MCMLELELRMLAYPCHAHSPLIEAIGMDTKLELVWNACIAIAIASEPGHILQNCESP